MENVLLPHTIGTTGMMMSGGEEMSEIKLNPCPICGKIPKVKRDYGYEASCFGAWCTIQCKTFFRKPHLKIENGKSTWERAYKYAIEDWNEMVEEIN